MALATATFPDAAQANSPQPISADSALPAHSAKSEGSHSGSGKALVRHMVHRNAKYAFLKGAKARYGSGGLQCVPFARAASGIELKGNAANWWDAAAGVYERGARPEPGSVLNFRSVGGMRLGHVAVVTALVDSRHIEIEHANWAKGGVSRDVPVVDVSPDNDWSRVRVAAGRDGEYGSTTYPVYGFIYDRPDSGSMVANDNSRSGIARVATGSAAFDEVAQAPRATGRLQ